MSDRFAIQIFSSPLDEVPQDLRRTWRTVAFCGTTPTAQRMLSNHIRVLDTRTGELVRPEAKNPSHAHLQPLMAKVG